ncbi:MAG: polyprenyl synthetase family protein [Herbinix sp.]|nr:polyprenyl synthetase family protein [Herbinix sp.]
MKFNEELQQRVTEIEDILIKFKPKEEGCQKTVMEAMNYSLMAGGKRLRPMLMSETFQLFGGQDRVLLEPFMAAIEMIHTYSLVHDDLPAMDNDEYRRGRKTTHVVYGEAMAILAGDGLLNYAFETALKAFDAINGLCETVKVPSYARVAKALQILSAKAGIYGMIGGQVIDMEEYEGNVSRERLDMMYNLKTGALIEASMMIGAVLAGAKDEEAKKIENIAGAVGLAFQIKDDILDVTSTPEMLGKPIHSDEKNEKTTYVSIMDLDSANNEVVLISKKATKAYYMLPYKNEFLEALIIMLINREK